MVAMRGPGVMGVIGAMVAMVAMVGVMAGDRGDGGDGERWWGGDGEGGSGRGLPMLIHGGDGDRGRCSCLILTYGTQGCRTRAVLTGPACAPAAAGAASTNLASSIKNMSCTNVDIIMIY